LPDGLTARLRQIMATGPRASVPPA
jgi:hypothetical protein